MKLDDVQKSNYLLGFQQLPNPESLVTNALNFQQYVTTPLIAAGYSLVPAALVRSDTAANQVTDINLARVQITKYFPSVVDVAGADFGAIATSVNTNIIAKVLESGVSVQNRWADYQNSLVSHQARICNGVFSPQQGTYQYVIPFKLLFQEISNPEFRAFLLHNGNTCQFNFRFVTPSECMIKSGPGEVSYTISNLHLVQSHYKLSEQQMANVMKSNVLYRVKRAQSTIIPCSQAITIPSAVPYGTRLTNILIGFHPQQANRSTGVAMRQVDQSTENLVSGDALSLAAIVYPLGFMPRLPIQQISLQGNGRTRELFAFQTQDLHLLYNTYDFKTPFRNLLQQQIK